MALPFETQCLVLGKKTQGEQQYLLYLFSPEHGKLFAFKKTSRGHSANAIPDLFDKARIKLGKPPKQSPETPIYFIQEYTLLQRYGGISQSYKALQCACEFGTFVFKNLEHGDQFQALYPICEQSFQAWSAYPHLPETILLKAMYKLALLEGYPVHQDWRANLPTLKAEALGQILKAPLEDCKESKHTGPLIKGLKAWLKAETALLVPN